jgi:hypothetical protein
MNSGSLMAQTCLLGGISLIGVIEGGSKYS